MLLDHRATPITSKYRNVILQKQQSYAPKEIKRGRIKIELIKSLVPSFVYV